MFAVFHIVEGSILSVVIRSQLFYAAKGLTLQHDNCDLHNVMSLGTSFGRVSSNQSVRQGMMFELKRRCRSRAVVPDSCDPT